MEIYDILVIGGGPAGYTAALYAARSGLKTLVLEKMTPGGQMALTHKIDNYPGFDEGVEGYELGEKMRLGAQRFGAETVFAEVQSLSLDGLVKTAETDQGTFQGKTVILSTGASHKELGLEEEKKLVGRGVSYCATCDGMFYRGKTAVIVGGGNTAAADALVLSRICKKVYLVHRRDTLRASKIYYDQLSKMQNVEFVWNSVVTQIHHDGFVTGVTAENVQDGTRRRIDCDGVFISVGMSPETALFAGQVALDAGGYVIAEESTLTNIPGVFAAGDVRTKRLRQVVTAAADGAAAAFAAEEYLAENG